MSKKANLAYVYRLRPTREQAEVLNQMVGNARAAWNMMLATQNTYYEYTRAYHGRGKSLKAGEALKQLNALKKTPEFEWLQVNPARCYDLISKNLKEAWNKFFKQPDAGKPQFKRATGWQSFQTDRTYKIDFENRLLQINGHYNPIKGQYIPFTCKSNDKLYDILKAGGYSKTITVKRSPSGKYYLSISFHDPRKDKDALPAPSDDITNPVGIDWGVKDFATLSDGTVYPAFKKMQRYIKKKKRLQRQAARKYEMNKQHGKKWRDVRTNNWVKLQNKIKKLDERIANIRKNELHNISTEIVNNHDAIAIEDLNVKGMTAKAKAKKREDGKGYEQNGAKRKSGLSRNILNHAPGEFARQLKYKSEWQGKHFTKVDRFYPSSKTCSTCGHVNKELVLSDRTWACVECGEVHERDLNAAKNIMQQGLKKLNS